MASIPNGSVPPTRSSQHYGRPGLLLFPHLPHKLHIPHPFYLLVSPTTGQLVASLPPAQQPIWQDLLSAANHHISTGVVAANNQQCNHYWHHWCSFLPLHIDPYLQNAPRDDQIVILQAFIEWTHSGQLGHGHQVKAGSVQDTISAIGKTFELAGFANPLYQPSTVKYQLCIACQMEAFHHDDPPMQPQLAVPVGIPNWIFTTSQASTCLLLCAIGELCLMAFYFLLCVGKYTQPTSQRSMRTQPFCLQDIQFYCNQCPITFNQLLVNPLLPDLVCLRIDNKKMGAKGKSSHTMPLQCPAAQ